MMQNDRSSDTDQSRRRRSSSRPELSPGTRNEYLAVVPRTNLSLMDATFPATLSSRSFRRRSALRQAVVIFVVLFVGLMVWSSILKPWWYGTTSYLSPVPSSVPSPEPLPSKELGFFPMTTELPPELSPELLPEFTITPLPTLPPLKDVEDFEDLEPALPRQPSVVPAREIDLPWWLTGESRAIWFNETIPALQNAPPPSAYSCEASPSFGPLLLVAVFSTAKAWQKRFLFRTLALSGTGPTLAQEVQLRFVVGKSNDTAAEEVLAREMATHSDIIHLDFPENMDYGKTYQFIRWVAERPLGERPQFTLKTDDDTFLVMPNVLRSFTSLNCNTPLYWGTSWGSCMTRCFPYYMRGMVYGLSWPLISWLAAADLPLKHYNGTEDARTGSWFLSLPPSEPLSVVDLGMRLGNYDGGSIPCNTETTALHDMKDNWLWVDQGVKLRDVWKKEGLTYMFDRDTPSS